MDEVYYKSFGLKPPTYKIIDFVDDYKDILDKVEKINEEEWDKWKKRQIFSHQKDSLTIPILSLKDRDSLVFKDEIVNDDFLKIFRNHLNEIAFKINKIYCGGEFKRVVLVKLPKGKKVIDHVDKKHHLENCRRIHLPIITDSLVKFYVNKQQVPMIPGYLIEINNNISHEVLNDSTIDRIHFILDWGLKNDLFYNDQ